MTVSMTPDELRSRLGRVGIWMPPPAWIGADPAATAAAIERAGFTSAWIGGGNATADALELLRPLLAGTERLVVATGIVNIWAWEPKRLRSEAAALAADFPGRFILGLGVSHEPLVTSLGHAYERPLEKMSQFLDEIGRPANYPGDGGLPPVVLAALGPRMLTLSAEVTAGAHPYFTPPEHTAFARSVLGASPLLVPEQALSLAASPAQGLAAGRAYAERYLRMPNYTRNLKRFGFGPYDLTGAGSDRLISAIIPSGPSVAAGRVREHLDAGADHVVLQPLEPSGAFAVSQLDDLASAVSELMKPLRGSRVANAGRVVQVMHGVVDEVPAERLDGERGAVGPPTRALPLAIFDGGEPAREHRGGLRQARRHRSRVLLAVPVRDRGLVLIPVREQRIVLGQHQPEPVVIQPEHVPDMAGVLQRRPLVRARPQRDACRGQHSAPRAGIRHDHGGDLRGGERGRVHAAFGAGAPQHPRPVLGIRSDRHEAQGYRPRRLLFCEHRFRVPGGPGIHDANSRSAARPRAAW